MSKISGKSAVLGIGVRVDEVAFRTVYFVTKL